MRKAYIILLTLAAALLGSCALLHDDDVVAKVGRKKLFRSDVVKYIPHGTPVEDSLEMARQYINAWAGELLMNEHASTQLSKKEKDVSRELADYKASLLKYRYEQHYIETHLDTVVTREQILERYETYASQYVLDLPIVKARYVRLPSTSPLRDDVVKMLTSDDGGDHYALDSLAYTVVQKYTDYNDEWIDMIRLSSDFGMDYGTLLGARKDSMIDLVDDSGMEHIAYVISFIPSGRKAPLEYCRKTIRDVIIEQRKYLLSTSLEQDLLDQARADGYFEIYQTDEN